jgi:F-type H+-transporting ATPase subunit a
VAVPLIYPVPLMFLGLLVCMVQTLVFILLSMVYIGSAVAHEEH